MMGGREREARWKKGTFKSYVGIETPHMASSVGKSQLLAEFICDVTLLLRIRDILQES